jgi:uncharacterized cupredoxin-like copper-binding protein
MRRTTRALTIVFALFLVLAACGDDDSTGTTAGSPDTTTGDMGGTTMGDDMHMGDEEYGFGEPAEASEATRVIEITGADDFTFTPANVTVEAGEVVTLRVTNSGAIPHDFALGDADFQDEHEAEMAEMGDMAHSEPNVFTLEPGETKEMTWHFTEAGEILFGCHQPGHYAAGMKGTLTIGS